MGKDNRYTYNTQGKNVYHKSSKVRVPRKSASKYVWRNFFNLFPFYDHPDNPHKNKSDSEKRLMIEKAMGIEPHQRHTTHRVKPKKTYHMWHIRQGYTQLQRLKVGSKFSYSNHFTENKYVVVKRSRKGGDIKVRYDGSDSEISKEVFTLVGNTYVYELK